MLNEIIECEQYKYDTKKEKFSEHGRLLAKGICENKGVRRAMVTIARFYMFEKGVKDIDRARCCLKAWCGAKISDEDKENKDASIDNWLCKYVLYGCIADKIEELLKRNDLPIDLKTDLEKIDISNIDISNIDNSDIDNLYRILNKPRQLSGYTSNNYIKPTIALIEYIIKMGDKRKQYGKNIFHLDDYDLNEERTHRLIKYENILAEASNLGPLKKYYLLLKDRTLLDKIKIKKEEKGKEGEYHNAPLKPKDKDCFLKFIAAFLLSRNTPSDKSAFVTIFDVKCWANISTDETLRNIKDKTYYTDNKKGKREDKVFSSEYITENEKKVYVWPEVIKNFEIFEEKDLERIKKENKGNKNAVYYVDYGSREPLEERQ